LIGIIAEKKNTLVIEEFFQLFKTPWELYNKDNIYDIVITTGDFIQDINAKLIIIFGSEQKSFDLENNLKSTIEKEEKILKFNNLKFPVYKGLAIFKTRENSLIDVELNSYSAGIEVICNYQRIVRIGYNIFDEIEYILTTGQPIKYATIPTVEIHIQILRDLIINSGLPFIEIPPVPRGYDFIACLTHDVDFGGIRNYKFDHTMFGFIYRAIFVSFINLFKRNIKLKKLYANFKAVFFLPLVYLRLIKDFWLDFKQYMEIERDCKSTYFFLPFKNRPGLIDGKQAPNWRASKYDIIDGCAFVEELKSHGHEIGLHGIDAWNDYEKGIEERLLISSITGTSEIGVRMHWLFYNQSSIKNLEEARFLYDSTLGYNDAIGYWAGTSQVFKHPQVEKILELPLNIQDTALFYGNRMDLNEEDAFNSCKHLINNFKLFGGVLVLNWHQRSLAPERLWKDFYLRLLAYIKESRVWWGTGNEVVSWFQKRRDIKFCRIRHKEGKIKIVFKGSSKENTPGIKIRLYNRKLNGLGKSGFESESKSFSELPFDNDIEMSLYC